ncbi:helix-turn-helix transcriptional regulator [Williamsia sp. CHRR-6]|nr:helix-turn-helix transcriptional regulator [Williamsia sp. CHRR-6]
MHRPPSETHVRLARTRAALTQRELAELVGVSRQSIVSIERGDYAPSVYLAIRLSRVLRTDVEELFPLTHED